MACFGLLEGKLPAHPVVVDKVFRNNGWHAPHSTATRTLLNPANGAPIATVTESDAADVDAAVQSAEAAFKKGSWWKLPPASRADVLDRVAQGIKQRQQQLALLETANSGKPLAETLWDMDDCAGTFSYYASLVRGMPPHDSSGTPVALPDPNFTGTVKHIPYGVVGAIVPWNYPLLMASWKLAPILAGGNSVVIKPSELSPLSLCVLADVLVEAGLPEGVVSVVFGGGEPGSRLVSHPLVQRVTFTGSLVTGQKVMKSCADEMKTVSLELGGKSPLVLFDDVAIADAVEWALFGCFWTNSQICSATSRLLVQRTMWDAFLPALVKATNAIPIGDPLCEALKGKKGTMGPLVSHGQLKRVDEMVQAALQSGQVRLLAGGGPVGNDTAGFPHSHPDGSYYRPTILEVLDRNVTIWKEEVFGPVLCVYPFDSEVEAVELANDSKYGLGAAVMTKSRDRLVRMRDALRAGVVWLNCSQPCFCHLPWGGLKMSGMGRDLGEQAVKSFMETKTIVEYTSGAPWGWYAAL